MALAQIDSTRFTKHEGNGGSSAARTLQAILHTRESWWERVFKLENLTVAGREVKGFVVSPFSAGLITTVTGVLLAASITVTVALYSSMSAQVQSQRDLLIEMKTRLEERTTAAEKIETKRLLQETQAQDENRIWRETMSNRMSKLEIGSRQ